MKPTASLIVFSLLIFVFASFGQAADSVENGKKAYAICVTCHGENGQGNPSLNSPRLTGQGKWYLIRQIKNFKDGIRGTHSKDQYGAQMKPMVVSLTNEQAVRDVATYISTLKSNHPVASIKADVAAGKSQYVLCATCHGENGKGKAELYAPKLSGQYDWYIARQLNNFKFGIRGTHLKDIFGRQMLPMALTLKDEEAINNIAAYIATFKN